MRKWAGWISLLLLFSFSVKAVVARDDITDDASYCTLIAVGDNLFHEKVINSGKQDDGTLNYDAVYEHVRDYIQQADIRVINQEVILTGDSSKWGGFPSFASPLEVGEAVVRAGFNVVTHATNHSWDRGRQGAEDTIAFWKSQDGVILTGMYDCQEDYDSIVVGEYNGIKVAFLNYTYGLNGSTLPSDAKFMVKLLDMDLVISDIQKAREVADIVIVFPHWGEEYKTEPNANQKQMAQQMADAGADLIIGCHPHVVQPLENIVSKDGRNVPCFYSIGNFVANMIRDYKCVEAMAKVVIRKDGDTAQIVSAEAVPMVNFMNPDTTLYTVYMAEDYTEEVASQHANSDVTPRNVHNIWSGIVKHGDLLLYDGTAICGKGGRFGYSVSGVLEPPPIEG
ncbi:MAG: CapA family protein [Clostridiales bacterium]|nr:CapA family protein [Clostridiales bacterium]